MIVRDPLFFSCVVIAFNVIIVFGHKLSYSLALISTTSPTQQNWNTYKTLSCSRCNDRKNHCDVSPQTQRFPTARSSFFDVSLIDINRRRLQCSRRNDRISTMMSLNMISSFFNGGPNSGKPSTQTTPSLPRDVKEAVAKCREATQAALGDRISRMDIDFPVGTKFGIEKDMTKRKPKTRINTDNDDDDDKKPTKDDFDKSDRELARIFVEMFQPVGSDHIVVLFNDIDTADIAKEKWKSEFTNEKYCTIMSLDRRRKSLPKKDKKQQKQNSLKPKGFAAKIAAEIIEDMITESSDESYNVGGNSGPIQLPTGTEVAIFVAPGQKEIPIIDRICQTAGMGTLIILLNCRKYTSITNFGTEAAKRLFLNEFQTIFHLGSVHDQNVAPGCLLYRTYSSSSGSGNSPWIVARKPTVGPPKTILVTTTTSTSALPPTSKECMIAYQQSIENLSDVEKNVETAIENVAKWFR